MGSPIITLQQTKRIQQTDFGNPAELWVSEWDPELSSLVAYDFLKFKITLTAAIGETVIPAYVRFRYGGAAGNASGTLLYQSDLVAFAADDDGFPHSFQVAPFTIANPGPGFFRVKTTMQMEGDNLLENITIVIVGTDTP